jgi:hypothetical protein
VIASLDRLAQMHTLAETGVLAAAVTVEHWLQRLSVSFEGDGRQAAALDSAASAASTSDLRTLVRPLFATIGDFFRKAATASNISSPGADTTTSSATATGAATTSRQSASAQTSGR